MTDGIAAALIAAFALVVGSVLTFIVGIRSLRRSVSTSNPNGVPLGALVEARFERLDKHLERMDGSLADVRERLAFAEGRTSASALRDE